MSVNLVWLGFAERRQQAGTIQQVAVNEPNVPEQVLHGRSARYIAVANEAVHFVALAQEVFGKVRPVLASDPRDQGTLHGPPSEVALRLIIWHVRDQAWRTAPSAAYTS
jgi:hypothetical protein